MSDLKINYKGKGTFVVILPNNYAVHYNTISNCYSVCDRNGVSIKKRIFVLTMTLSEFINVIELDAIPTAEAHEKIQPKKDLSCCIGRIGKTWNKLCEGSFAFCKAHEKNFAYAYDEVKTIYEFNLGSYGIN